VSGRGRGREGRAGAEDGPAAAALPVGGGPPELDLPGVVERELTVRSELGLHARPAGRFVSLASRFRCEIWVGKGEEWVSGRSVLSILSLAAGPGTRLRIRALGEDAMDAVDALEGVLAGDAAPGRGV
jgi:phosphocarrier protein HPr